VCLLLPQRVLAQNGSPVGDGPMTGSSEVLLGVGVANGAAYLGSDDMGDNDRRPELGAFASYALMPGLRIGSSFRYGSGYALYMPGSGLRDVGLQLGGMVNLGSNAMLMLGLNAHSLMGNAVDSPLTRKRTAVGALAALSFRL
jgi:hypothetical protein